MKKADVTQNLKTVNTSVTFRKCGSSTIKNTVDFRIEVLEPILDILVRVSTIYYVPNLVGKHEKAFYNRTINFCTYLRKPFTDRVLKIIYEHLDQRGNLPKRCPVATGTYTFKTCFDGIHVPSFFPESSFRVDVYFRRPNSAPFFQSSWFGEMRKES
uniref:MD-2-related lipid-recognition domain-containing protein n=1 Tax=Anopheles arabiensis TaxID=7173 RepID=A0A2C9GPB9_ANOAR